uniref:Formylglycine-generating enzyme, required for sulfatase activity, contains SUMF1/FGE domain n=1 Tax=Candidatus Kentrum sp. DK TaxID=2126562 RepID=A0A450SK65_9GAMM|nr:MAG: Formylglycine-generating enzyme, required for sulfatase activity, contains SUMF1/FGE domain [Candidatus Kentron sp. DK]
MKKIALLIGIGRYPASDLSPLPAAPEDARALSAVLANPELGGFTEDAITLLTDPVRGEMELAIERLFSGRDRDDLALLYFSGHGIKDETGALYLAAFDTCKSPNGELLRASAVSAAMVLDNMARSRSRRQVVILDSCYSGAFPVGFTGKDDGSIDIPTQLLPRAAGASPGHPSGDPANGQGRAILTASTAIGQAFQQDNEGLSLYTRFLIRGIETGEADASDNGFITVDELHGYARRKVEEERPAMEPAIYVVGGGGDIRIAQVPVGDPRERYRKEVSESLDERGEFLIAARPRLADWRVRLGLDKADYAAIEAELGTKRRGEFDEKCRQYDRLLREILEKRGGLAAEATHLADYRKRLGLPEEEARGREEKAEEAFAAERDRHERNLEIYQASFRTTLRREGAVLSDGVLADLVRLQETLAISEEEAAAIRERVRREEARPRPEPTKSGGEQKKHWTTDSLVTIIAGIFTIVASALAIWAFIATQPNRDEQETAAPATPTKPHVIIAQAEPPSQRGAVEGRVSPEGVIRQDSAVGWAKERSDVPIAKFTPEPGQTFRDRLKSGGEGPKMVVIPAGKFLMGSPPEEKGRDDNEGPQHLVSVAQFALGATEVTFAEYDRFARATGRELPSDQGWGRENHPVIDVSWKDATAYAEWLSRETGERYRLPTEAEWEYAARAGTTTPFSTGECIHTTQANYDGNYDYAGCGAKTGVYRQKTVPVGSLPPNPWGLYEMHGNVWEWNCSRYKNPYDGEEQRCASKGVGGDRVLRGGSWDNRPRWLRSADRNWSNPVNASGYTGFRLARAF